MLPSSSEISRASEILRRKYDPRRQALQHGLREVRAVDLPQLRGRLDDEQHAHVVAGQVDIDSAMIGMRPSAVNSSRSISTWCLSFGSCSGSSAFAARSPAGRRGQYRPQAMQIIRIDADIDRHWLAPELAKVEVIPGGGGIENWVQP